jgi:uncharacterized protein with HEPN domain
MKNKLRRVPERARDIHEAIGNATNDLGSLTKEQFLADGKTQRAVIESIIVIGEAANHLMRLAPSMEDDKPTVWQCLKDAYDMRIILTHEYFRIDAAVVWDTIKNDLPRLISLITPLLEHQEEN